MLDWIFTPPRLAGAAALLCGYVALCAGVAWKVQRQTRAELREQQALQGAAGADSILLIYASQTGHAESLARKTAQALHAGGCSVRLMPVQQLQLQDLEQSSHSLWLLSTTGEGDAPDHALPFVRKLLPRTADLSAHQAVVLALGDRNYAQFCAFGLRVKSWLKDQGAQVTPLSMHSFDAQQWQTWQTQVEQLAQSLTGYNRVQWPGQPRFAPWVLRRRTLVNPGSQGGAVCLLQWVPQAGALAPWQAGDLVELTVPCDPDYPREYSIASIPEDGCLELLVRQSTRADGTPGLASGWLCSGMKEGDSLPLRVRAHSGFRQDENAQRPMVLIGNGTGLAGLCSHIKQRVHNGRSDQWLLFGERSPEQDAFLDEQLQHWLRSGQLARLDRAWSRDVDQPVYVQRVLAQQAKELQAWVARGAAIYVCGSQQGMAQGVDAVLREVLGSDEVDALMASGRYRRDVY